MSYDDAYVMLLTCEAKLEQSQGVKIISNANNSIMNANYFHMRGNFKRGLYGNKHYGHFGNKRLNVGKGMFFHSYLRGFPTSSGNFRGYGKEHAM